jgi:hypothetical protein
MNHVLHVVQNVKVTQKSVEFVNDNALCFIKEFLFI